MNERNGSQLLIGMPFELDAAELMTRMRVIEGSAEAMEFETLVQKARDVAVPKATYRECFIQSKAEDSVIIEGLSFVSRILRTHLDKVDRVFPFICTCGRELDEAAPASGDFMKDYWWDAIKEALLKTAIGRFDEEIRKKHQLTKTSAMHPGSGDVDVWPIGQQRNLFELLGDAPSRIGVSLTESCLMIPVKTVSGFLFQTEHDFRTCQLCHRDVCPNRSAPFDRNLWESIQRGV